MTEHNIIAAPHKFTPYNTQLQIDAYGQWVRDQIAQGWDAYLFTFELNQLTGPHQERMKIIRDYLHRWYGRLATRTVRHPKSPK
jgi:hypothetical protein